MRKKDKLATGDDMFSGDVAAAAPEASPPEAGTSPGEMGRRVSPLDIQQKEFRVSRFGGYKMRDVDEFLDVITDAMNGLVAENERLRTSGGTPVVGTSDLDDVNRQADEIIQRARDEAASIVGDAQRRAADASAPLMVAQEDRAAITAFLAREKGFLQSLAGLVQDHAESVRSMAKTARQADAPPAVTEPPAPMPASRPVPPLPAVPERTAPIPKVEPPVRVEEPEPASVARGDANDDADDGDSSLRELFWGED